MSHHKDSLRVSAIPGNVFVDPAQRLGNIPNQVAHFHLRPEAIVRRDKDESLLGEHPRFDLHIRFIPRLPAAAMNPEHYWQVPGVVGRVNVEDLAI